MVFIIDFLQIAYSRRSGFFGCKMNIFWEIYAHLIINALTSAKKMIIGKFVTFYDLVWCDEYSKTGFSWLKNHSSLTNLLLSIAFIELYNWFS